MSTSNQTNTTPTTTNISSQKSDVLTSYQALLQGIDTLLTGIDPFVLNGTSIPRAELKAKLQARVDALTKTLADRKQLATDVATEKLAATASEPVRKALRALCIARYGATNPILQQLGFVQNRARKIKAEKKAAAVTKAIATRKANGTKGKQQRAGASTASEPAATPAAPSPAPVTTAARAPFGTTPTPANGSGPATS